MHHIRRPPWPLSQFVAAIWLCEGTPPAHAKERVLPDGSMGIIINLHDDYLVEFDRENPDVARKFSSSILVGASTRYTIIDTAQQISVAGIHFKPGGAFPFFKPPGGEFQDSAVALDALWRSAATEMRERMQESPTAEGKLDVMEQYLMRCAVRPFEEDGPVTFALRAFNRVPHGQTIADVTSQLGLSARRFIDLFRAQVGLTPKLFCRVRRFHGVIERVHRAEEVDWTDLALSCGYYDQAHFIRDFRGFAGVSPNAYLANRGEFLNHIVE